MDDDRKLTFGGRRALNIIGTPNTKLYREEKYPEANTTALREPDKKILDEIDGKHSVRQIISGAGLDFETGLHSIAWLMQTGYVYSSEVIERILQEHSDKLAFFAEIFSDPEHDQEFWEKVIADIVSGDEELGECAPGLSWEGLSPAVKEPPPSPVQLREYFVNVMVALYDKAEEILGADAVLAKRILLDSRRPSM